MGLTTNKDLDKDDVGGDDIQIDCQYETDV